MRTKEEIEDRIKEVEFFMEESKSDMHKTAVGSVYNAFKETYIRRRRELMILKWVLNENEQ